MPHIRSAATRGLSLPRLIVAVAILSFVFQSFLTETHLHIPGVVDHDIFVFAETGATSHGASRGKNDADDPAHCPLCQIAALVGAYVPPAPVVLGVALYAFVFAAFPTAIAPARPALVRSWYGRAPPRI